MPSQIYSCDRKFPTLIFPHSLSLQGKGRGSTSPSPPRLLLHSGSSSLPPLSSPHLVLWPPPSRAPLLAWARTSTAPAQFDTPALPGSASVAPLTHPTELLFCLAPTDTFSAAFLLDAGEHLRRRPSRPLFIFSVQSAVGAQIRGDGTHSRCAHSSPPPLLELDSPRVNLV